MFNIGQKVVCINDAAQGRESSYTIKKGGIYTVSGFYMPEPPEMFRSQLQGRAVLLKEGKRGSYIWGDGWFEGRFQPINEKKTDISIFTEILKTGKIKRTKKVKEPV